ncbi:MAG: glycosyltransferase [Candidatus Omnitrophica bacterium]|nr:glycosyltransferase [Candidatus Omnitrophota bacterium]
MINCSIGIIAYNEQANIGQLLESLVKQDLFKVKINKIVVVSSGSTDNTNRIVEEWARTDNRITLFAHNQRKGKSIAINEFLNLAEEEIVVVSSADILPDKNTIENLVAPFLDKEIGMTGTRSLPVNSSDTFIGFAVNLLWQLHHFVALEAPKLGEMIAFRNIVESIPGDSAVDEASFEAIISQKGLKLKYVPEAVVRNKGPENIKDFIMQRRRICSGHLWLKEKTGYEVSTNKIFRILRLLPRAVRFNIKNLFWTFGVMLLEFWARCLGTFDIYILKKNPYIWQTAKSTKQLQ